MGDTGSLIVGFLLAFFAVKFIRLNVTYIHDTNAFFNAPVLAVVLLIVPIFDTLRVFLVRILNKRSPFKADRNHMHHVLLDNGLTHFQTSLTFWSMTIINVVGYFLTFKYITNTQAFFVLVGLFCLYLVAGYFLKIRAMKNKKDLGWSDIWKAGNRYPGKYSWARRFIRGL